MATIRERYLMTEKGREAVRKASAKQEAKRKEDAAKRRDEIERYTLAMAGLGVRERREAVRQFRVELKERDRQDRLARLNLAEQRRREVEQGRQQKAAAKAEGNLAAERRRWSKMVSGGVWDSMDASEKRQWLERCRDVNPILYRAVQESGVT